MKPCAMLIDPLVSAAEHDRTTGIYSGLTSADHAAREEIARRAYEIWECEGHPEGRELSNWLQAEAGVLGPR